MNPRWLLRLYPLAWRRRYEEEVASLLEERHSSLDWLDVALGALDARLRPQVPNVTGEGRTRMPQVIASGVVLAAVLIFAVINNREEPASLELGERHGTLSKDGEHYLVDGQVVDAGPDWYITRTAASTDYDGDGAVESVAIELDGLVGMTVTLGVEDGPGGESSLFIINGQNYRNTDGGRPPWAGGPHANQSSN
jgi:hypothetical protein